MISVREYVRLVAHGFIGAPADAAIAEAKRRHAARMERRLAGADRRAVPRPEAPGRRALDGVAFAYSGKRKTPPVE